MEEIRKIPSAVTTPQPVGSSHSKKPGENREEFRDVLEREGRQPEPPAPPAEPEAKPEDEGTPVVETPGAPEEDRELGRLLDRRA
ncbi:MAG: hypothetical protein JW819_01195 [Candidatus Krumholzibacteriota bacterium]|nr:hypothetical protein [Candidatus Krumholzibacteriota bacterium]